MLRICIPVHNEATTIGVLLWRLRSVFQGFSREYDVVVYDDASTDGTGEVLEPYQSVMPLTVIRGGTHRGYAASIDAQIDGHLVTQIPHGALGRGGPKYRAVWSVFADAVVGPRIAVEDTGGVEIV